MKIKKIAVKNIRSIEDLEFEFNGCSAIVTGKNSIGKSTFLKFLFDRLSQVIDKNPIWKQEENRGVYTLELDNDTILEYEVEKKEDGGIKEKLNIIYPDGKKEKLTRDLIKQLYPKQFDLDKFLELKPKEKLYYISDILGNEKVKEILPQIEELRKEREHQYKIYKQKEKALDEYKANMVKVDVDADSIENAKKEKQAIIQQYEESLKTIAQSNELLDKQANDYLLKLKLDVENAKKLKSQKELAIKNILTKKENYQKIFNYVENDGYSVLLVKGETQINKNDFLNNLDNEVEKLKKEINDIKILSDDEVNKLYLEYKSKLEYKQYPEKPDTSKFDAIIEKEKDLYLYKNQLKELERLEQEYKDEKNVYIQYNNQIENLEAEIRGIFTKMSNEKITFSFDGIYYNDKPIDRNSMSTSELYKAGIYLGSLSLGEIRTLVFDISSFDKNSFNEVLEFAKNNDIQLLVEKPDWEGSNTIKIEITEK